MHSKFFSIAIDGPSGAGKSTVAKEIAGKMNIIYVDTGALYRAIGYHVFAQKIGSKEKDKIINHLHNIDIKLEFDDKKRQIVMLNNRDVSDNIRTPEIAIYASNVSAIPEVRSFLLNLQRDIAKNNSVIMDGRDIATVILPDATVKIYLTASPEVRAHRRYLEFQSSGIDITENQVLAEINKRDHNDMSRETAPLRPCGDSVIFDTTNCSLNESIDAIENIINGVVN